MDLHLSGKAAIVTGASRGIGLAVTRHWSAKACASPPTPGSRAGELSDLAGNRLVRPIVADLSTPDGPAHLVDDAIATLGRLDILVNNLGAVRPRTEGLLSITADDWLADRSHRPHAHPAQTTPTSTSR